MFTTLLTLSSRLVPVYSQVSLLLLLLILILIVILILLTHHSLSQLGKVLT